MRQSKLFTKTIKEAPKDETSFNAEVLIRGGFIEKVSAGVYSFLPLGLRVHNKICHIIREEMNAIGGQEILMPSLTPKRVWEQTGRWDNFDVLFKLAGADKKEYALGATHEEIVVPLVKKYVSSYKELPAYVYQIQTKFRNELRAKAGLIRGREFSMKDLYSFHTNKEDLDRFYELAKEAYFKVYKRCGLGTLTYLTFASGGAFSKYSHEFQTLTDAGEDTIYICDKCKVAVNKEIIGEQKECPVCKNGDLREEKAVEVGNIFKLGTRFSEPFGFSYADASDKIHFVEMGCYGLGPSRTMGTIVEVHHDEKGIIWPEEVAPYAVHLLSLGKEKETRDFADDVYDKLIENKIEVLYDDRDSASPGAKFADADLIGIPLRLVVSGKTVESDSVEIKKRDSEEIRLVKKQNLLEEINA
ncbi:MAG: His/Gly/Thr/Pro-type tRNA ligase C-terminal domain-containing protein [Candidatus Portnoybacteria bacterium]|nr:His/Gly/Thr/Pro-type tRNA ligase C-terminal domain-containing protein [Candidatus Portnoybacteria bacterium]